MRKQVSISTSYDNHVDEIPQRSLINPIHTTDKNELQIGLTIVVELHRIMVGSLLVAFVPQKCGDQVCKSFSHLQSSNPIVLGNFLMNIITFVTFLVVYGIEIQRESKLMKYLTIDKFMPIDSTSIEEQLECLSSKKKKGLLQLNYIYKVSAIVAMVVFVGNSGYSAYTVYTHYLDDKTITGFATNLFFIASKLYNIHQVMHTEQNVFLSAYLKDRLQYNCADPSLKVSYRSPREFSYRSPRGGGG
jgi:hypothetical protein